jgi:AraC-like DNA-binding protein
LPRQKSARKIKTVSILRVRIGSMPKLKYVDNVMTAFDFIESHLLDPDLSIKEAAKTAGFSEFHFSRIFLRASGRVYFGLSQGA